MIGIVDYGCGNLRSLQSALEQADLASRRVRTAAELAGLSRIILPGVGHFGHARQRLQEAGLDIALKNYAREGGFILGICLGMQLLGCGSAEAPAIPGLGLLPVRCQAFPRLGQKIPHTGWNQVRFLPSGASWDAYFVHSYLIPRWPEGLPAEWIASTGYSVPFLSAFRSGTLAGCQFHPEKSGPRGLAFLKEVLTCC